MANLKITDIRVFLLQPEKARLAIVKVLTNEKGLFGLGCSTFTQRIEAVALCVDRYLKPFLAGKDPSNIEDIWRSSMVNSYWRNGPVLNNAVAGVDMALWDIKGKMAGMPCYELWGGKSREGAAVYVHANGREKEEVSARATQFVEQGFQHVRCQLGGYRGTRGDGIEGPTGAPPGEYFDPKEKLRLIPELFSHLRRRLGEDVELLYDVHERLAPVDALWLAKALEPYRLFFLEDMFAPEDIDWFVHARAQCATPLAMGELFSHPQEIVPLVSRRLIDFIRVHPSDMGGASPALRIAHLCEYFGVRTAWHGPGDVSPVGMAVNVHMDVTVNNFGIQEWAFRSESEQEIFHGIPEVREGYVYPNDRPGWGIDFDEKLASRYPVDNKPVEWTVSRLPDGSMGRP
jgi:mannonate dehydratase